jgi:lysophospholipase L1-like esterase
VSRGRNRVTTWWIRWIVAGSSAIVGLVLAEILVGWIAPQATWSRLLEGRQKHFSLLAVFEPCDYLPFRLRPGSTGKMESVDFEHVWRINAHGFREPDRPLTRSAGERRILALGDSFTAGHGVEEDEAWPRVLEYELRRSLPSVRVVNAGYASGYAPDCYYAFLSREVDRLQPDLVVVGLFAGNDSYEMMNHFDAELDSFSLPTRVLAMDAWVDGAGRRRLTTAARPFAYRVPLLRDRHLWILASSAFANNQLAGGEFHTPHRTSYIPSMQAAYERSVRMLRGIRDRLDERGIPLLVAIIPDAVQVDSKVSHWAKSDAGFDPAEPQRRWRQDLSDAGVNWIDLLEPLRDKASTSTDGVWGCYHRNDRHFTAEGQRVMAIAVGEWLRTRRGTTTMAPTESDDKRH